MNIPYHHFLSDSIARSTLHWPSKKYQDGFFLEGFKFNKAFHSKWICLHKSQWYTYKHYDGYEKFQCRS